MLRSPEADDESSRSETVGFPTVTKIELADGDDREGTGTFAIAQAENRDPTRQKLPTPTELRETVPLT